MDPGHLQLLLAWIHYIPATASTRNIHPQQTAIYPLFKLSRNLMSLNEYRVISITVDMFLRGLATYLLKDLICFF